MTKPDRQEISDHLRDVIGEVKGTRPDQPDATLESQQLTADLGLDSLDLINVLFRIEEDYGLKIAEDELDAKELIVFGKLVDHISQILARAS